MNEPHDSGQGIEREVSRTIAKKIAIGIALLFGFLAFIFFGGIVVRWLWNWLVPDIFGLRRVTFWEALGLLALCRILFGGFGKGGSHRYAGGRRRSAGDGQPWWTKPKAAAAVDGQRSTP